MLKKNELLIFLNEHNLLNNIRTSVIENLMEFGNEDSPLIKYTRKIFDVLIDDVFTKFDSYYTNPNAYNDGIVVCYFSGYMLSINGNGTYYLHKNNGRCYGIVREQKGKSMKFDDFVQILRDRKLAYPEECTYEDASLYILNIE